MQDLKLKTAKANGWLERSDTELSILINTVMNQKTLSSEMKEDILKIHKFFLDSGKFVEDSKKCVVGVGRLVQVKDVEKVTVSIEKQLLADNFDSYLSFKYLQTLSISIGLIEMYGSCGIVIVSITELPNFSLSKPKISSIFFIQFS